MSLRVRDLARLLEADNGLGEGKAQRPAVQSPRRKGDPGAAAATRSPPGRCGKTTPGAGVNNTVTGTGDRRNRVNAVFRGRQETRTRTPAHSQLLSR
jgi:hypothetical protein